jgi:hypothetical protein
MYTLRSPALPLSLLPQTTTFPHWHVAEHLLHSPLGNFKIQDIISLPTLTRITNSMCFGSSMSAELPSSRLETPRPAQHKPSSDRSKMPGERYAPPPGPPPSQSYIPPPGPPLSHSEYAPPAGPPPSRIDYAPPLGPPPTQTPFHDWQSAVPDTSLFPPPPSVGNQQSRTNNATEVQAEQGESWCRDNPLLAPVHLPQEALFALQRGEIGVVKPRSYIGVLDRPRPGVWAGKTNSNCPDSCITSSIPLYLVHAHSPLRTGQKTTIYYEVRISKNNRREVSLALGFSAPPYPTFRLPGWHRGSLAVHGDDGSKFINDRWGGKDFTVPFKPGETLGIGMSFEKRDLSAPPSYGQAQTEAQNSINVKIFLTRDGTVAGSWNLHEEADSVEDLPVTGLEGYHDLSATVGVFEGVEFEIVFVKGEWMFHP